MLSAWDEARGLALPKTREPAHVGGYVKEMSFAGVTGDRIWPADSF